MGINKVQYGNTTLIDLTGTTATADKILTGYGAFGKDGGWMDGTATGGSGAISVVDTTDTHGGTIRTITAIDISDTTAQASDVASGKYFYTADGTKTAGTASGGGGDTWSWMGKNPTFVKNLLNTKVYLKDSPYATWTPSTTTTTLVNTTDLTSETLDCSDYDNLQINTFHTHFEYTASATGANLIDDYYYVTGYVFYGQHASLYDMTNNARSSCVSKSISSENGIFYKNNSGEGVYKNANYGVYLSSWTNPSGSSSEANYTFTPSTPTISARCNSTYFTTTNASAVDLDTSYYEMKIAIWRVDPSTTTNGGYADRIRDMWLNGF